MKKVEKIAVLALQILGTSTALILLAFCIVTAAKMIFKNEIPIYDTSAIEGWQTVESGGQVRMVCGWPIMESDGTWVIEDESGHLWRAHDEGISKHDFLLLWCDTKNTDTIEDDTIVKIWREVY